MTTQPEFVRHNDLLNQLVIHRDTLEELGRVETLWMYAPSHRVLGFICKSGFLGGKKLAFNLAQVSALGENGILTQAKPQETDNEKVRQLESVIHCEIWSDSGEKVGKVIDYRFNLRTGEIAQYLFTTGDMVGPIGEIYELFPSQILSIGQKRVLVPEYAAKNLSVYREGLKRKLTKATEFLKEDYTQVTQELKSLTRRAQEKTEQAKGRWQNLTEQVKQRAQSLTQQAQETVHHLNDQLREEAQHLVDQAKETSYVWSEQLRDQTENLSHQMEDGIETLTVQAREILDSEDDDRDDQPPIDLEDPEAYFDALFGEIETTPPQPPNAEPAPVPNQAFADAPVAEANPAATEHPVAPNPNPELDNLLDDFWDDIPDRADEEPDSPSTTATPKTDTVTGTETETGTDTVTVTETSTDAISDDDDEWV